MTRTITPIIVNFIKSKEELILRMYDDAQPNVILTAETHILGKLTGGYGHTNSSLKWNTLVTQAIADMWLMQDLQTAADRLAAVVKDAIIQQLTEHQYGALISFVFNVGSDSSWTIWKILNAGQFDQVPAQLALFVNAHINGKLVKVSGLVNRRNAEIEFWSTAEPGSVSIDPPSSVTRAAVTPPTVVDPVPVHRSAQVIGAAVAAVSTVPAAVQQASNAISPYAQAAPFLTKVLQILAMVGAAAAVTVLVLVWIKKQQSRN